MIELVTERGYNGFSVVELTNRARVSKRDFYKLFGGKEECFLTVYDIIVSHSLREIVTAAEAEQGWRERLRLGLLTFADQITGNSETARLALVEAFTVGAVAVERTRRTSLLFEALMAKNLALTEGAPRLPPQVVRGVVAGGFRLAQARLLCGDPSKQPALDGDELLEWAFSFFDEDVARLWGLEAEEMPPNSGTPPVMPLKDERALILAATAKLASKEGYATLTVPRVRAAAGVSRHSFDTHFEDVADCLRATLETLSDRTLAASAPVYLTAGDWARGIHRVITDLCWRLARDPTFADLAFREVFSPCPETIQWRSEMIAKLATRLRRGAPSTQRPSELAAEASIGALWGVIQCFVASGRGAQLPGAVPSLSYLALAPALGGAAAVDVIVSEVGVGARR
jgi:AcrR family transcriptional regulator